MDSINLTGSPESFAFGEVLAGVAFVVLLMVFLIIIGLYIYHALAWQSIGRKQKYKRSWLAWIPFANVSMILQMGGFHWAWVFLFLVPILGWIALLVLITISMWRIFETAKYPGWLSLTYVLCIIPWFGFISGIAYMITIGIIAWEKKSYKQVEKKATKKKK